MLIGFLLKQAFVAASCDNKHTTFSRVCATCLVIYQSLFYVNSYSMWFSIHHFLPYNQLYNLFI